MKIKKFIVSLMIIIMCISITISANSAFDYKSKMDGMINGGGGSYADQIKSLAGSAVYITQVVAVGVAVTMLIVLAIKYMSSSAGDRATIKKHAVTYVVGAMILFASTGILQLIKEFAGAFNNSGSAGT